MKINVTLTFNEKDAAFIFYAKKYGKRYIREILKKESVKRRIK